MKFDRTKIVAIRSEHLMLVRSSSSNVVFFEVVFNIRLISLCICALSPSIQFRSDPPNSCGEIYLLMWLNPCGWETSGGGSAKKWWRICKKISHSENNATYGPSSRMIFSSGTECGNNSEFLSMKTMVYLPYFLAELQKVGVPRILVAVEDPF